MNPVFDSRSFAFTARALRIRGQIDRRRFLFSLPTAALLRAADPAPDAWPQFRGNPQLTGVAASPLPATLKLLWTYEAGDSIESSAAIADGAVYVGSMTADLLAIDLETGKLRWKYKVQDGIEESSPAVRDGVVYVGDLSGLLHAVNAADGKSLWTIKTGAEVKSSPVIVGDRLLFGSYDGNLFCVVPRTGAVHWKFTTSSYVHCTPAVSEGFAFIAGCDEMFRAIRITDGKEVFHMSSGGYNAASPAIAGKTAFFGNFNNEVLGLNLATHRVLWRYEHPVRHFPFYSSPAVADGKVVIGGRDKIIHCLDTRTGKALWTFTTNARVDSSPAICAGRAYVGSNDGRLYTLDVATGKKLCEFNAGGPLSASPAIAQGKLVIGSQDGKLFCLG
jgi:outer membrane protein assembly factor BamB